MKRIVLALSLSAAGAQAQVMANLVRQYIGASITGQTIVVCVYQANGQTFENSHPLGTACPTYIMVR